MLSIFHSLWESAKNVCASGSFIFPSMSGVRYLVNLCSSGSYIGKICVSYSFPFSGLSSLNKDAILILFVSSVSEDDMATSLGNKAGNLSTDFTRSLILMLLFTRKEFGTGFLVLDRFNFSTLSVKLVISYLFVFKCSTNFSSTSSILFKESLA